MLNWFLGLAGIIMGVAIGQAVTNGTEGQRDTGRKFVLESFFSGSVPPAATSCYVSNGDMKYCMGVGDADKKLARRSNNKDGLVAYGLGMRASNDEKLWGKDDTTTRAALASGKNNTRNDDARSTWSMAGSGNRFFISYNIEEGWFSNNEVVGNLMAAKIARSSANIIGVAFSTGDGVKETVYWKYGSDTETAIAGLVGQPAANADGFSEVFGGTPANTAKAEREWKQIVPAKGTKDNPVITVLYEL